jgi:hypothetical protein
MIQEWGKAKPMKKRLEEDRDYGAEYDALEREARQGRKRVLEAKGTDGHKSARRNLSTVLSKTYRFLDGSPSEVRDEYEGKIEKLIKYMDQARTRIGLSQINKELNGDVQK